MTPRLPATSAATMTVSEAAEVSGINYRTLYRAIADGEIKAVRVRGSIRVLTGPLMEMLGLTTK